MIQRIEDVLLQRCGKIASLLINLHVHQDGQFKNIQERHSLACPLGVQARNDSSRLSQPVRRLKNTDSRLVDRLKNLESLEGVGLVSVIGKDPLTITLASSTTVVTVFRVSERFEWSYR